MKKFILLILCLLAITCFKVKVSGRFTNQPQGDNNQPKGDGNQDKGGDSKGGDGNQDKGGDKGDQPKGDSNQPKEGDKGDQPNAPQKGENKPKEDEPIEGEIVSVDSKATKLQPGLHLRNIYVKTPEKDIESKREQLILARINCKDDPNTYFLRKHLEIKIPFSRLELYSSQIDKSQDKIVQTKLFAFSKALMKLPSSGFLEDSNLKDFLFKAQNLECSIQTEREFGLKSCEDSKETVNVAGTQCQPRGHEVIPFFYIDVAACKGGKMIKHLNEKLKVNPTKKSELITVPSAELVMEKLKGELDLLEQKGEKLVSKDKLVNLVKLIAFYITRLFENKSNTENLPILLEERLEYVPSYRFNDSFKALSEDGRMLFRKIFTDKQVQNKLAEMYVKKYPIASSKELLSLETTADDWTRSIFDDKIVSDLMSPSKQAQINFEMGGERNFDLSRFKVKLRGYQLAYGKIYDAKMNWLKDTSRVFEDLMNGLFAI